MLPTSAAPSGLYVPRALALLEATPVSAVRCPLPAACCPLETGVTPVLRTLVDLEHFLQRDDDDAVGLARRALRGRVVLADGLDGVADEVEADRLRVGRPGRRPRRRRARRTRRASRPGPRG